MNPHNRTDAKRIRLAKEQGRILVRQMGAIDKLSADEVVGLAEAFAALIARYPDVYPHPPVSLELLRAQAQALKEAEALVKKEEAEAAEATRKADEARRLPGAAPSEVERAHGQGGQSEKPG